jgi:dihydrofolate synthase/folylpolyglutamate synthase
VDPLSYLFGLEQFGIKFGLDNIRAIVARLGHPERSFRSIHVAGTNGKGSVTAMVDAGLRAAGHRVGRYTSPHLVRLNERFAVAGRPVDDETMLTAVASVQQAIEALIKEGVLAVQPTFFEATTAAAFEIFRRANVELAVVEVGLGGRLDATNVLSPEVTAITSIAFDHQLYLGSTLESIAIEKAGILEAGVPVVLGPMDAEAESAIRRVAADVGAPIVQTSPADVENRVVELAGAHQRANAAIAVQILQILNERGISAGSDAIAAALSATWPGRMDFRRLADGRELLMDAAHNAAGAEALAAYLRAQPGGARPLVFAAMRDKDVMNMFRALLPSVSHLVVTRAETARSADPKDLAQEARAIAHDVPVTIEPSLPAALAAAWRIAEPNTCIVVAGSIFLLGDVMKHLGLHC